MQKIPTLNLLLSDIPASLDEGIYACRVTFDQSFPAVMHYGPRPVHHLSDSCEVHILDQVIEHPPETIEVQIVGKIRDIQHFEDPKELLRAIRGDIANARAILGA